MHAAAAGFDTSAGAYERARPSYPPDAVADLVAELGIGPGRTVVDLGAGTGKLTRLLVPTGARVVAVEPSGGMRAELQGAVPAAEVFDGTAESIPLDDGAAAAAVAAQAFHWFDGDRALAEIARVVEPGGTLALIWNVRERSVDWVERLADVIEPYRDGVPTYRSGDWKAAFDRTDRFDPLQHRSYGYAHETDASTMVERVASISWVAALPTGEREAVLDRVQALFDGMPERFPVPYRSDLWWCRARP
ncbi:MAG: class I SAM-dependent methyltransferase [Acidimicrobiia bacterium]